MENCTRELKPTEGNGNDKTGENKITDMKYYTGDFTCRCYVAGGRRNG